MTEIALVNALIAYSVSASTSKNSGFSEENIDKIISHIFEKEHLFEDGTVHKFFPDYDMAQSWIRLREGKHMQKQYNYAQALKKYLKENNLE